MTSPYAILLRTHEIAIKGGNRAWFEKRLIFNLQRLLKRELGEGFAFELKREQGRILLYGPWNEGVRTALSRAFGLNGFSPMRIVPSEKETIQAGAIEEFRNWVNQNGLPASFRVTTRRSDKIFPETSTELDHLFGGALNDLYPGVKIEMKNPALNLGIEIRKHSTFIWTERIKGPGGLPASTNGDMLSLLSGGIDSPIAAIQMIRRGGAVHFIHFHGTPFVGDESLDKVQRLAKLVNQYQPDPLALWIVPFGLIQEKIARVTNPKIRTILYRRMMLRIASELAAKLYCKALITGESLGQVASQTLDNLATINRVAALPVLRPLVGLDKDEIIALAKRWGTFETSIEPTGDCCTLFADRHPHLRCTPEQIEDEEKHFSIPELIGEALDATYKGKY